MTNFWVKSTIILSVLPTKNFLYLFKNKNIYNFMIFVATKKVGPKIFFLLSSFCAVVGSGMNKNRIRNPG
jgi:hypothetical protein